MHIEYNNLNVPSGLNEKFFNKTLRNVILENDFEIKEISFTMGSSAGENYCSEIYRAKVLFTHSNGKLEKISLIIKSLSIVAATESLKKLQVFPKEKVMYFDVLPKIHELLKNVKISPKCYYTETEPISTIVFEDLKVLGYDIENREIGLNLEYARTLLQKLAKYHAATMVVARDNPEILSTFKRGFINTDLNSTNPASSMLLGNFKQIRDLAQNWPGYETIIEKLIKMQDTFHLRLGYLLKQGSEINVINHGDVWVNNVLFKKSENEDLDAVFVDFQLSYYHTPALDLNYFFHTSLELSVLKHDREELVKSYHGSLESSLEELGIKAPTLDDIKAELIKNDFYSLFVLVVMLPIVSMKREHCKDNSIDVLVKGEKKAEHKRNIMFSTERVVEILKYSLKRLDDDGVLDQIMEVQI